jgi:glycosyltransferase involved in cell wall biosynthesis
MLPLVSTIIPVFNRPTLLREAVQSVLDQSWRPIEILVIDDGSTDSTPSVIRELEERLPDIVRPIRQANAGPSVARETGRLAARGEFIQYLDSDDLLLPRKFEVQVAALQAHPECDIAYGKTLFTWIGQEPLPHAYRRTGEKHATLFPSLLVSRWWCTQTPLYRRTLTDRIGPWSGLWSEEDWEYDARAAAQNAKLHFCDEFVSVQRAHQADQHLSYQSTINPRKLQDRARAHELILGHAQAAGLTWQQPEMQHFARALFLLARQCGAAGLAAQSRRLLNLSRSASGPQRSRGADFRLYETGAGLLGWTAMGRLATWMDKLRP